MPDKTADIKDLGYVAKEVYNNKEVVNEEPVVTDRFISFRNTDHEHPYDVPEILKIEDIFGFMMCYRKPYHSHHRKSLKNYRNRLTKYCRRCSRFPDGCKKIDKVVPFEKLTQSIVHVFPLMVTTKSFKQTRVKQKHDTCRVKYLKEAMTREIRGPIVTVGGSIKIEVK